ncbi:EscG/YscG/SsaH family type III secretion system needle protein co-chaperone [Burkholderia ubonensis]|uniref:EscG/YscG/SsaH family type III secretion system needle protein co-chaperone n=1 Tax=Burkholderia ubonensis TaxID=101571 RepID=UPI0009B2EFA4|nr:EscG/YscG/SsaH family type III secretion system needle protein co-chaperone [Burkholderia ubonensis]
MNQIDAEARRRIVEAGLAACNHGLLQQAWAIYGALPRLIADPGHRNLIEAVMLVGLGRDGSAARLLEQMSGPEADIARRLLLPESKHTRLRSLFP